MRRRHRPAGQWRRLIADWRDSGLSVSQFCRDKKVPASAFYRWRTKLRQQESLGSGSFVQVALPSTKDAPLELAFPAGHVLRFAETTPDKTLASVLAVLQEAGL